MLLKFIYSQFSIFTIEEMQVGERANMEYKEPEGNE